ncbi:patatin-like phospholipase family protein [Lentibacillus cibarius]|uniref:Patatin-like phospholipase family protein n=1 Tax=Lentibacillus cibarius TaxID=2583219 RepID=A0A549YLD3_9BACI|nr:patatin-like phospholipase family protein [Lentibacillus cibarius]TRM12686.1 patatin-like phospholipase family protein [Lentibacillus cibarius]
MKIDGVFSGGGVKAYALLGAIRQISAYNHTFERVAGSSAGAMMASLLSAGFSADELERLMQELDMQEFLDSPKWTEFIPFSKWLNLYFRLGLYKGKKLEHWMYKQLAKKGVYTFSDLQPGYLKVVVSDISLGKLVVIPDDLERVYGINPNGFPVAKAVRMSAGFPYFFMPEKIRGRKKQKSLMVDGGLLSNFPLWVFEDGRERTTRPVLGVKLSGYPAQAEPHEIRNGLDMFHALFRTMLHAHDARYVSKSDEHHIIFIPVNHVSATDFTLPDKLKKQLINVGEEQADAFLRRWPN